MEVIEGAMGRRKELVLTAQLRYGLLAPMGSACPGERLALISSLSGAGEGV